MSGGGIAASSHPSPGAEFEIAVPLAPGLCKDITLEVTDADGKPCLSPIQRSIFSDAVAPRLPSLIPGPINQVHYQVPSRRQYDHRLGPVYDLWNSNGFFDEPRLDDDNIEHSGIARVQLTLGAGANSRTITAFPRDQELDSYYFWYIFDTAWHAQVPRLNPDGSLWQPTHGDDYDLNQTLPARYEIFDGAGNSAALDTSFTARDAFVGIHGYIPGVPFGLPGSGLSTTVEGLGGTLLISGDGAAKVAIVNKPGVVTIKTTTYPPDDAEPQESSTVIRVQTPQLLIDENHDGETADENQARQLAHGVIVPLNGGFERAVPYSSAPDDTPPDSKPWLPDFTDFAGGKPDSSLRLLGFDPELQDPRPPAPSEAYNGANAGVTLRHSSNVRLWRAKTRAPGEHVPTERS